MPVPAGNGTPHRHVTISEREHICPVEIKPLDFKLYAASGWRTIDCRVTGDVMKYTALTEVYEYSSLTVCCKQLPIDRVWRHSEAMYVFALLRLNGEEFLTHIN